MLRGAIGHKKDPVTTIGSSVALLFGLILFSACSSGLNSDNATPQAAQSPSPTKIEKAPSSPITAAPGPSPATSTSAKHSLTASPNPVPAGAGAGTSQISWHTVDVPSDQVHVYVVGLDGKEVLFATGSEGSQAAPWITTDVPVEFRLYAGSGAKRKLLDKLVVSRSK